ncbi:Petrobactin import ATP-binding protein YclP [Rhodovastum atsumiense]|uniref:ATP-binding cassette domain-containing protein n=1 Tax=Rhodovastum atsumiense TaxID=504468 RepID=A0A5M6IRM1_9PROT|nr:ATP-binding cassette domain-containing protein [Rhodovastum atsumiense]KAA5610943.1 ATP-binding cassette domain-containing protein [Rhodovastum atsumiense]CAH2601483.1 Petrobactin import ATP-binding protein YclP [Rhodovastum atsumiense]
MIEITDVTKTYGGTPVVDAVSLRLPPGGVTSLIGPNGAGKSTLLAMIGRLTSPDRGTIRVGGLDVARTPGAILAKRLAIMRQDTHVTMRLTVRDLVAFGRYPHCRGRLRAEDQEQVEAALRLLELEELADRFLDLLSGGQRQRAFIAMALCQGTDHVLLDEPLNNLDPRHAAALMRLVRRLADSSGRSFVLVLHDINLASCWSDALVAMRRGRVVLHATPAEVMRPEVLRTVFDTDMEVHEVSGRRLAFHAPE